MSTTPAPHGPGRDEDPPGVPEGPGDGDYPRLGSPDWTPVPQSPDWDEAWLAARAGRARPTAHRATVHPHPRQRARPVRRLRHLAVLHRRPRPARPAPRCRSDPYGNCDHRHQAKGHDPGVMLRHLTQIRHATCTGPGCRRPAANCDVDHNIPYEADGRTCLCNTNPKCRHDHRLKQDPRWQAEQLENGDVRWTAPSGRQYVTEPTRYPV